MMRICLSINKFWKSRPIIEATRAGSLSLPGQPPSAFTKCPLPAPATGAPCTTSQSPLSPGSAPRGARTSRGANAPCPRAAPPALGLPDFSQHRHNRAALEPRTAGPGGHPHPRAGGSGRPDPASTPAGRYRLAVQTGGRPATCSSGCGHPGQTRPSFAPAATIRPQPRWGRLPTAAPANRPDGQQRTRCSPRHRRRQAAGCYLLPGGGISRQR